MIFNYQKICSKYLEDLPGRTKDILLRRFGLDAPAGRGKRETLASIGKNYGITRERVRQIEKDGILKIKPKLKKDQKIFQHFTDSLKKFGDLKKEDILLDKLGRQKFNPHIFFLLTLADQFERFSETRDLHSLWTIDPNSLTPAQEVIDSFYNELINTNKPLELKDYIPPLSLESEALLSYLEISKQIQQNPEGAFGLKDWPEINPRGVKDKAFLVFKKEKRPLHFSEVANLVKPAALVQTVHNELIRDPRFVLVGRGLYVLGEWGYEKGTVKDIILKTLKKAKKPLLKKELVKEVLKQRFVKENTILLNLSNKKYFLRNSQGKYTLRNNGNF